MVVEVIFRKGRPVPVLGLDNERFLILGSSGSGKSMTTNYFVWLLKKRGYKVVYLTEKPGGAFENAFMAFEPKALWHRKLLDRWGVPFEPQSVELLVPFSLSSYSNKKDYPSCFRPYVIDIKRVYRESWGCLLNKDVGSETVNLCYNTAQKLDSGDDVFVFGRKLFDSVGAGSQLSKDFDFVGLGLPVGESGDSDSVKRVSSSFSELVDKHFLLSNSRDPLLLDWVSLLNDNDKVSFFSYDKIRSKELRFFLIVQNLISLDRALASGKVVKPLVVVFEEVTSLLPRTSSNLSSFYEIFLSVVREFNNTSRSKGRGVFTVATAQSEEDTNKVFLKTLSDRLLLRLNALDARSYHRNAEMSSEKKSVLENLPRGYSVTYARATAKAGRDFYIFNMVAPFGHKEESFVGFEQYWRREGFPMQSFASLLRDKKSEFVSLRAVQREWFKATQTKMQSKDKPKKERKKDVEVVVPVMVDNDLERFCYDLVYENPDRSFRELVRFVSGVSHHNTLKVKAEKYAKENGLELNR